MSGKYEAQGMVTATASAAIWQGNRRICILTMNAAGTKTEALEMARKLAATLNTEQDVIEATKGHLKA